MKLIELPFDLDSGGRQAVDPDEVEVVNLAFANVFVGMRSGTAIKSATPKMATAIIEGQPDKDKLREWYEATLAVINEHKTKREPLAWSALRAEKSA